MNEGALRNRNSRREEAQPNETFNLNPASKGT